MSVPVRWVPDVVLPEAVIAGRVRLADMASEDACYVVAELSRRGESVQQIADRLGCTPRHAKRIRAQALTQALGQWAVADEAAEVAGRRLVAERRAHRLEVAALRASLADVRGELARRPGA